ncbi:helix-turn-helix domain-containing protein [Sphingosinicella terrae]|uniref:helix-turn-helix domain-containing protein n=1 Tax=Sphingosinicella terrae TaxID=2172047 RepID=UPI000E0D41C8|nr:helix-turn-helix domain-containing protein [Sphingosinicella terrae]
MPIRFEMPPLPPSVAILPLLFQAPRSDDEDWNVTVSLAAACAAERACLEPRNSRARLAYLLCEFAFQFGRRTGADNNLPLDRSEIAQALGISLVRVKRILGWLELSRVVASDASSIRIIDWHRLCQIGRYEGLRIGAPVDPDQEVPDGSAGQAAAAMVTRAGEPACFV